HRSIWCKPSFQNLVPADDLPSPAVQEFLYTHDEVALKLMLVFKAFFLYTFLAVRTGRPAFLGRLVPADVDDLAWKQFYHFGKHVLQEDKHFFFSRTVDVFLY